MESESRYEILDKIASGEFATVCRARDRDLGREVAVKQIHAQYLADPRQLARYCKRPNCWHPCSIPTSSRSTTLSAPAAG